MRQTGIMHWLYTSNAIVSEAEMGGTQQWTGTRHTKGFLDHGDKYCTWCLKRLEGNRHNTVSAFSIKKIIKVFQLANTISVDHVNSGQQSRGKLNLTECPNQRFCRIYKPIHGAEQCSRWVLTQIVLSSAPERVSHLQFL